MQILITDVTGAIGRPLARQLLAAGHTVRGIARTPHAYLHPLVDLVCAPLGDPVLVELAHDADVVIHLAPVEKGVPGSAGIDGLVRVADATAKAGARLVVVFPAAGRPEVYRPAERLVSSGWAPNLVVRIAPPVGRQVDWMVARTVATLLRTRASSQTLRLLHLDDLLRFLVHAAATDRTGVVDLATRDTVDLTTAHKLLRSATRSPQPHRVPGWEQLSPELDVAALQDDWSFECGWSAAEALADTANGLVGRKLTAAGAIAVPGHLPMMLEAAPRWEPLDGPGLRCAAPDGLEGEFDDRVDPRFPVFSASNLTAALPGPMTPMTLDVQLTGLRIASQVMGQVLALPAAITAEFESRGIAVFGHRPYLGVSTGALIAASLPGFDEHDVVRRALGDRGPDLFPLGRPTAPTGVPVAVVTRALTLARHLKADTEAYRTAAAATHLDPARLAALTEARLAVRLGLLRDRIHQGWSLVGLWAIDNGVTAAALARTGGTGPFTAAGLGTLVHSERVAVETAELTEVLRHNPHLLPLAGGGDLAGVRAAAPGFAAHVEATAARMPHRGPGEVELANPTFGDDPTLLLTTIMTAAVPPPDPATTLAGRLSTSARVSREAAHDATMRFTHELRMTLREMGSRRVAAELIDDADDVWYLTCDELLTMPADARLRIKRRRAERERLQALLLPDVFVQSWAPAQNG